MLQLLRFIIFLINFDRKLLRLFFDFVEVEVSVEVDETFFLSDRTEVESCLSSPVVETLRFDKFKSDFVCSKIGSS